MNKQQITLGDTAQTKPKMPIETRLNQKMENFAKYFVLVLFAYIIATIFHVKRYLEAWVYNNDLEIQAQDLVFAVPGYLFSLGLFLISTRIISPLLAKNYDPERKRSYENDQERIKRMGVYIYGMLYYSTSTLTILLLCWNSDFLPKSLGGKMHLLKIYESYPQEIPRIFRIVYLLSWGHHIESAITEQLTAKNSKSKWIMALHGLITITLIFYSFIMKHYRFGFAIMITHDSNDIFLNCSRFFREYLGHQGFMRNFTFLMLFLTWGYTRLYTYFAEIFSPLMQLIFGKFSDHFFSQFFFVLALNLLLLLNLFWFFQISKILVTLFIKKKAELAFEDAKVEKKTI